MAGRYRNLSYCQFGYFYNASQYTLGAFLGEPLMDEAALAHWREVIKETVLRALCVQVPASVVATTTA
ncbi:hypothetical protein [Paraburkholderia translucens]|uniref:hypothetical protein n=1 Tax=Paraburkholderia translucens TaxID=2886945 RepID=UPI003CE54973